MIEVEAKCHHRCHVQEHHPPNAEAAQHVCVDVGPTVIGEDVERREVQDVEDDEEQQQRTAPSDRPRGECRDLVLGAAPVADGARHQSTPRELNGGDDVHHNGRDQHDADDPQQLAQRPQEMRVRVEFGRSEEDLQVAEHVADDEADTEQARHGHDDLLADRRVPERSHRVHAFMRSRASRLSLELHRLHRVADRVGALAERRTLVGGQLDLDDLLQPLATQLARHAEKEPAHPVLPFQPR